jgi:sugar phosphate isomerase/epimerase
MLTSRRNFLFRSALATAGLTAVPVKLLKGKESVAGSFSESAGKITNNTESFTISIFSKHLQWLDYDEMAKVAADMGFDGIDLTVRPGGHVIPEKVATDLPKAMESVKKAGLNIFMITTSITNADDPLTDKILRTASSLGIRHYRTGYGYYDNSKSIRENIGTMREKLSRLAVINEKYSITGEYQNHSGVAGAGIYFGGPLWDLAWVLNDIGSEWIGSQYDIYHAMIEGGYSWPVDLKLIAPFIKSIDIKDFIWRMDQGKWSSDTVPLGEGMVDFGKYLDLIKQLNISCPISIHYEYPLGGAEHGAATLTIKRDDVISAMRKDIVTLKEYLKKANLVI